MVSFTIFQRRSILHVDMDAFYASVEQLDHPEYKSKPVIVGADQKSGKPMSAVYVLQREGVEAQYPNLGAARSAVNKTIIHPEKLTVSKAEHAAERAAAKK